MSNREGASQSSKGQPSTNIDGAKANTTASAWQPLSNSLFRAIWLAAVASNIGTWMHNVGADWLMTTLAPSPWMVALMQTAENAPLFLLALPAGALADIAASLACHAAIKVNMPLSPEKMRWLIDRLLQTSSPTTCPHGRPVILRLGTRDILKGFHRI